MTPSSSLWLARRTCLALSLLCLPISTSAWAETPCRHQEHERACLARQVGRLATLSNTPHYSGYYVGGSTIRSGDGQGPHDGTWGWDYGGIFVRKWVTLGWTHGQRYQGGSGAYRTAGPTPLRAQ